MDYRSSFKEVKWNGVLRIMAQLLRNGIADTLADTDKLYLITMAMADEIMGCGIRGPIELDT